ncbi:MAG: hypothetical protein IMZ44_24755, partial [Planctomycetes bacterium]|nr:hypothetical protein [Planctomycetota bacterium]
MLGPFTLPQISQAERGRNLPCPEMLLALSQRGISTDWFLTGEGPKYRLPLRLDRPVTPDELRQLVADGAAPPAAGIRVPFSPEQEARLAEKV